MSAEKGYSLWTAMIFLVSFNAGLGLLALPHALSGTGWFGLFLIFLACANSCYSAYALGQSWLIMERKWDEYKGKFRYPYPAMGMRAVGPWMRYVVTVALHLSALGTAVVYLLLSAQVAQSITETFFSLDYGYWIIILAVIMCPLTWFGSIEEFQFAGIGSLSTMVLACLGLFVTTLLDMGHVEEVVFEYPKLESACLSFGAMLFAFGGIFFYPTVQNDMRCKEQFMKATILSFTVILTMYIPVTVAAYWTYGSNVAPSLVLSQDKGTLRTLIEICLAIHAFLAFILEINPVFQEFEEIFKIPSVFNYKRCLSRTSVVFIIAVIAYTVPHFDKVLNLVGGSTLTFLTFICPSLIYFLLRKKDSKLDGTCGKINVFEGLFMIQIILVGIAGGISCTYFAVIDIAETFKTEQVAAFNSTV